MPHHRGIPVGDVHGGISISVPMEPFRDVMLQHVAGNAVGHGLLWLLGLCGISGERGRCGGRPPDVSGQKKSFGKTKSVYVR